MYNFSDKEKKGMAKLYRSGVTLTEIANIYNISIPVARRVVSELEKIRSPGSVKGQNAGELTKNINNLVSMYKNGKTLAEIGKKYGVTRERIRQVLKKAGITWRDGGNHVRSIKNTYRKERAIYEKRNNHKLKHYGVSIDRYKQIADQYGERVCRAYMEQKRNANRKDDAEWLITLDEWLSLWVESGKFDQRGRYGDGYVLTRKGATGPFSKENCYITTLAESSRVGIRMAMGLDQQASAGE